MSIFKQGGTYWYKFMFDGELIRESTKQGNDRKARQMEAAHKARLAKEQDARKEARERLNCPEVLLCGQCEKWFAASEAHREDGRVYCSGDCLAAAVKRRRRIPRLAEFLEQDFKPYVEVHHAAKPRTVEYYVYGVNLLLEAGIGDLLLNEVTSQHAVGYIAKQAKRSPSTVNCGLRTLRRAMNLAEEWKKLDRAPKFELAKGERQRERIVSQAEFLAYRELCRQPWRDVVTVLYGTAISPGEAYRLRWEHVLLNGSGGLIQIAEGKSKAARRYLPMVPEVYITLKSRHEAQGHPATGWVFPTNSASGHLEKSSAQFHHTEALGKLAAASAAHRAWKEGGCAGEWMAVIQQGSNLHAEIIAKHAALIQAGFSDFEIYCHRHSALTMLGESGCDAFTLAKIAGHSSITMTMRYVHPQADAIERAFQRVGQAALTEPSLAEGLGTGVVKSAEGGHKVGTIAGTPNLLRRAGIAALLVQP